MHKVKAVKRLDGVYDILNRGVFMKRIRKVNDKWHVAGVSGFYTAGEALRIANQGS